jgi:hypothetical protein
MLLNFTYGYFYNPTKKNPGTFKVRGWDNIGEMNRNILNYCITNLGNDMVYIDTDMLIFDDTQHVNLNWFNMIKSFEFPFDTDIIDILPIDKKKYIITPPQNNMNSSIIKSKGIRDYCPPKYRTKKI